PARRPAEISYRTAINHSAVFPWKKDRNPLHLPVPTTTKTRRGYMTISAASPAVEESSATVRKAGYLIGPCFFLMTFLFGAPEGMDARAWHTCGLALWMACWWITEAMPLPVSSLLPVIFLPLFNIVPMKQA